MNITWETFEGETEGYGDVAGYDFEISIGARVHGSSKWNVKASNIRHWTVRISKGLEVVKTFEGRTEGLPQAKKDTIAKIKEFVA